nr:MAG TPA: hypothetical protein [Caudoviricetes sp.]
MSSSTVYGVSFAAPHRTALVMNSAADFAVTALPSWLSMSQSMETPK